MKRDKQIDKFMKEQHKKIKQYINRRYILKPLLEKKMKETGRDYFTKKDIKDINKEALQKIKEGEERRRKKEK